jgi:Ca2+-binding RTX toxin-like protein
VVTTYKIKRDSVMDLQIRDGDTAIVEASVSIVDPSVADHIVKGLHNIAGIEDHHGGHNRVNVLGVAEGHAGAYFGRGFNTIDVGDGGLLYGDNAGVELFRGGHNDLIVRAGGEVSSDIYGVWCGDRPSQPYTNILNSGKNTIDNDGLIESHRREAIRMVFGGNHIVNGGTIKADVSDAIHFDSALSDPRNAIVNTGSIVAGPHGAAIVAGNAALSVANDGQISGDIVFGAGADRYDGDGTIDGTICGGAGNDILQGGGGDMTLCGGAGADHLRGGLGVTTFLYNAASESTGGQGIDTIDQFDFSKDYIVVGGQALTLFEHIATPEALKPGEAAIVETRAGEWFMVVDANAVAGYQAGADYMIHLTHPLNMDGLI